jgi:uncharacterized protein (DUF305 family)
MIVKAGLIVAVFMHMAWERLALRYAILVPPGAVLLFVAIMAFESDYTRTSLGSHSSEWGALLPRPRPLGSKPQGLSTRAGIVTSPAGLPFSDFNRNHGQLSREEAARLRSRAANLSQLSTQRNHHETHTSRIRRFRIRHRQRACAASHSYARDGHEGHGYEDDDTKLKMMEAMPKFTGDADIDFMKQMRTHHEAAIDIAKVVLANGKDADTKKLAQEIIAAQEKEIATIDAWLKKKGA